MSQADIELVEQWILNGARKNPDDKDPCLVPANMAGTGGTP